ncbi:MAG: glycosyltransferase family 4 protein [Bacteroidales bacterium]|jgi:glycosyltransferase involved in cell wall biosynthesis|nr:glycosyltransferase family 4 protein [Bacteroidales bacterium]
MKILIVNTSERTGGAAVAANRLMKALNKAGHEAKMLVCDKQTNDPNVVSINTNCWKEKINFIRFVWERWVIFVHNRFNYKTLFKVSIANTGTDISKHPLVKEADIIHLHWINQGFLSLKNIRQLILSGKPMIWTMHDMWACTGICHHSRECISYQSKCGNCFHLNSSRKKDLSFRIFSKKKKIWVNRHISFVGCSKWLEKKAIQSPLMQGNKVYAIPNPIDITTFKPMEKEQARKQLKLPLNKQLLLFGAVNITDKQKGFDYLQEGLVYIKRQFPDIYKNIELVIFGQLKSDILSRINVFVHSMNYLKDETTIALLYNAVDLFVTPSLEENLPNTIMEAMSCGTPCVGFNTGGIPEMIDHKVLGYVAEYKSAKDLAAGINWCLKNNNKLMPEARKKTKVCYTENVVAKQYIDLYTKMIKTPMTKR